MTAIRVVTYFSLFVVKALISSSLFLQLMSKFVVFGNLKSFLTYYASGLVIFIFDISTLTYTGGCV